MATPFHTLLITFIDNIVVVAHGPKIAAGAYIAAAAGIAAAAADELVVGSIEPVAEEELAAAGGNDSELVAGSIELVAEEELAAVDKVVVGSIELVAEEEPAAAGCSTVVVVEEEKEELVVAVGIVAVAAAAACIVAVAAGRHVQRVGLANYELLVNAVSLVAPRSVPPTAAGLVHLLPPLAAQSPSPLRPPSKTCRCHTTTQTF